MSGFYGWRHEQHRKIPLYVTLKERPLFSLAGIFDRWYCRATAALSLIHISRTAARQYAELRIDRKGRMDEIVLRNAFAEDVVALGRILQVAVDAGEQHLDRGADDFEVAQLFGRCV